MSIEDKPSVQDFVKGSTAPQNPYTVGGGLGFPPGTFLDPAMVQAQTDRFVPQSAAVQLSADVAMTTANTVYAGPSLTLTAGTWLLIGCAVVVPGAATDKITVFLQLTPAVHDYPGSAEMGGASAVFTKTIPVFGIATVSQGTLTAGLYAVSTGASATMKAAVPDNPPLINGVAAKNATSLQAVLVG